MIVARRSVVASIEAWSPRQIRWAALVVGSLQTAFVAFVISTSGYFRDDFPFFSQARQGGFSETDLSRGVFGSLVPGFQLANSLLASLHPIPRWPAVVIPTVLYALALLLFFRLGELLVGSRPQLILLLGAAGLCGVLAISLVWWTAGINSLPAVVCDLLALDGLVRHRATGRRRYLVVSIVAFAVGIAFYDASSSFLLVLVLCNALYLVDRPDWRSIGRGFARYWWVWACYVLPIALNFGWRQAHKAQYSLPPLPTIGEALRFAGAGWAQGFVPSLLGFDFSTMSSSAARAVVVVGGQLLFFAVVGLSIWRRRRDAVRAWVVFAGGFAGIELIGAVGRGYGGTTFALNTVYWAVQPFVLALVVGLAFLPSRLEVTPEAMPTASGKRKKAPDPRPWDARVVGLVIAVTVLLGAGGVASIWTAPDRSQGAASRAFMTTLQDSWNTVRTQEPGAFVWNTQVPPFVVTPLFVPYNRVSSTAGLLMSLRIDGARGPGYLVGPSGGLEPAGVQEESRGAQGSHCFNGTQSVSLSLRHAVPVGNWFLRLSYTGASGFDADIGGQHVAFKRGSGALVIPYSLPTVFSRVSLTVPSGASACVTTVAIEAPVAK